MQRINPRSCAAHTVSFCFSHSISEQPFPTLQMCSGCPWRVPRAHKSLFSLCLSSTPLSSASLPLSSRLLFSPPLLHTTEHAACSSHLLALQTLEIFSCKPCRFRQTHIAFARRRQRSVKARTENRQWYRQKGKKASCSQTGLKVKARIYKLTDKVLCNPAEDTEHCGSALFSVLHAVDYVMLQKRGLLVKNQVLMK